MHWGTFNRIITAQWEGMGDVGSVKYEPALLPSCPTISVLSYSNHQEIHPLHFEVNVQKFNSLRVKETTPQLEQTKCRVHTSVLC